MIVSGFLISPYDQERMRSGLAIEMRIWSKLCGPRNLPEDVHQLVHGRPLSALSVMPGKAASRAIVTLAVPGLRAAGVTEIRTSQLFVLVGAVLNSCAAPARH